MAANKLKFEMTLEKLSFKFEGDYEQGQKIQTGISRALGDLANLQSSAMGAKTPALIDVPSAATPPPRRKRRKTSVAQNGDHEDDTPQGDDGDESQQAQRRNKGQSPTLLLKQMRQTGFFESPKSAVDILNHLTTKGHTSYRHSDLTSPLANLCKREILSRSKPDGSKTWQYSNGTMDE